MGLCSDELGQRQYTLSAPQRSTERPVVTGQSGALAGRLYRSFKDAGSRVGARDDGVASVALCRYRGWNGQRRFTAL